VPLWFVLRVGDDSGYLTTSKKAKGRRPG